MFDSCTLKTGGCVASLPDDGCYWYRWFKDLIQKTENPWHTGTPTEGGLYFVYDKYAGYGKRELPEDIEAKDLKLAFTHIVAWQKIEPYKEKEK